MQPALDGAPTGTASRRDLIVVGAGTLLFLAASVALELNEKVFSWTRSWEHYQLDELPGTLMFLALALSWFAWRRVEEARRALRLRVTADRRLAEALTENRRLLLSHVNVQEEERKELARELHDELSQHLNAIKIHAVSIRGRTQEGAAELHDAALAIVAAVDHVHGAARGMLRRLRPVGLDELGLAAAIEHLVQGWRVRNPDVSARLQIDANVEALRENENIAIYRLVQEGLNNVTKHARARSVSIRLAAAESPPGAPRGNRDVVLTIADDGTGTGAGYDTAGLGLVGMRERVEALRGHLAIEARAGAGFRITATIPQSMEGIPGMSEARQDITVLLVDDHSVVREGYRRLLERSAGIHVSGEAGNAADAYAAFCRVEPDVVVMDISLPDQSGIEAMRHMLARDTRARTLIFSMHEEPIFASRAFQAGALGYVTKASAPDVLVEAVRAVAQGQRYLSQDMARTLALESVGGSEKALDALSHREFEVMRLLVGGVTVAGVAEKLQLSYKTVANYQSAIRQKLGAETHAQLVRIAARNGVVT